MKKLLSLIAVAVMAFAAQAASLTVANGSAEAEFAPFYGMYMDTQGATTQTIYPAEMLADMQGGLITEIRFYAAAPFNGLGQGKLQLALKEVEQNGFTSTDLVTGATVVDNGYPVQDETELVFVLDEPFAYNGGNLLIETVLTIAGGCKTTKFIAQAFDYAVGLAAYTYSWSTTNYYESEPNLPKATFTYEPGQGGDETTVASLAEANALEDDAEFTFNGDAVVTVCKNGYVFLRDESGYGQIKVNATLENGQVLSQGWKAKKATIVDPWVRFTDATGLSANGTNAELAKAQELTAFPDESMLNAYVVIKNAVPGSSSSPILPQRYYTLQDGSNLYVTSYLWNHNFDAGNYNVYGVICKDGGKLKIQIVEFETIVEPTVKLGDVNKDGKVTIADVTALIDALLSGNTDVETDNYSPVNADVNERDGVTIADVTALIDLLLSGEGD